MFPALLLPTRPEVQLPPPPTDPALAWPPEAQLLVRDNYQQRGDAELARLLQGRFGYAYDVRQVEHRRHVLGLHRTAAEVDGIRLHNRHQPGRPPRRARRARPEGAELVRTEAGPNGQRLVRFVKAGGRSKPLAVANYEAAFGPVPRGYIVTFRDGDTLNCAPENLLLLTRAENAERNRNKGKAVANLRAHHAQRHHEQREEYLRLVARLAAVQGRITYLRSGARDEAYTHEQLDEFLATLATEEKQLDVALFRLPESVKYPPGRPA